MVIPAIYKPATRRRTGRLTCGLTGLIFAGLSVALFVFAPGQANAQLITTLRINGFGVFVHEEDFSFPLAAWGTTELNLKSEGNPNVRGEFQLDSLISEDINFSIPRAYLRFRFDGLRFTIGKTRLAWGEGFLFNAGDVLFEGWTLPALNSTTDPELRIKTDWLVSGFLPFGDFSFFEAVVLPHPTLGVAGLPVALDWHQLDMGGRVEIQLGSGQAEAGYLYRGEQNQSLPYLSLKSRVSGWDLYGATSISIPYAEPEWVNIKDDWNISLGMFRLVSASNQGSVSLRWEAAIKPLGKWEEESPSPPALNYGLYLFTEINLAPNDTISYTVRALYSPIDGSIIQLWGFSWSIFENFALNFLFTLMSGDENDLFGWGRPGDMTLTLSCSFSFGSKS